MTNVFKNGLKAFVSAGGSIRFKADPSLGEIKVVMNYQQVFVKILFSVFQEVANKTPYGMSAQIHISLGSHKADLFGLALELN